MIRLPAAPTVDQWPAVRRAYEGWLPAARAICARHALPASELRPADSGTNVVFLTPQHAVKLYPPFWADAAAVEWASLEHVAGRLPVATPEIVAAGALETWPYLVTTRLHGTVLCDVWRDLAGDARRQLAGEIGRMLRALHALPATPLDESAAMRGRWPRIVEQPVRECVDRHRAAGVDARWLDEIGAFLERRPALAPESFVPVLLEGDVHQWHLVAAETASGWRLTGLFDFDDAMLGWREYDLTAPAIFMLAGRRAELDALRRGYGADDLVRDDVLGRRLIAYALLNRYWGLDVIVEFADPSRRCATLAELERAIVPPRTE